MNLQPLAKPLRSQLDRTVREARDVAETAARAALEQLGVGTGAAFSHLSPADCDLRRRLRAHGRQLGDVRTPHDGAQSLDRLAEEVAYEHWHRMLFARFLAENNLLMYPDPVDPVPVTLEECNDLAADEGAANGWELAAQYAARMLPRIFRLDSPVFELTLPPEHQQALERLVDGLPPEVFSASDSLGWVYQFWQTKRKDEVNASEVKIGARELPAVTQLFTEPYMVSFLLDNSLGAWWAGKRMAEGDGALPQTPPGERVPPGPPSEVCSPADSADEHTLRVEQMLREHVALPDMPLSYLRFVPQTTPEGSGETSRPGGGLGAAPPSTWLPAAGTFEAWPDDLGELKVLDPCCGSGHFLVATFLMLVPIRMAREGLSAREAVDRVLTENLHGLELDRRCVELAAFALAFAAWRYPGAGGYRPLPELNVACCGLSVSVAKEEWKQLALDRHNLRIALDWMYDEFKDAPVLGSLLDPSRGNAAKVVDWNTLAPMLEQALKEEQTEDQHEAAVVAHGLAKAAQMLAAKYQFVVTNVPYLKRGKQGRTLREFCERQYSAAKGDLATAFLDRCLEFCVEGGAASVVLPQNWLFLTSYRKLRERLLKNDTWHLIARMGAGAFETISGEVVKAILLTLSRGANPNAPHPESLFAGSERDAPAPVVRGVDVSHPRTAPEKAMGLQTVDLVTAEQEAQLRNPDARVALDELPGQRLLADLADYGKGSTTGDGLRFLTFFWEFSALQERHVLWLNSPSGGVPWSGRSQVCKVQLTDPDLNAQLGCWIRGRDVYTRIGVAVNKMGQLEPLLYRGEVFDDNICPICPRDEKLVAPVWAYVDSPGYSQRVRAVDQALKVTAATITKVPFDLDHWTKVAEQRFPHGLPQPYSDDPTQWIFHGHPCGSVVWDEDRKWTAHGELRTDATVLQTAVARLLGYRWPTELDREMELAEEQRQWVDRCQELLPFADEDGIVCIAPVRGESSAADRLLNLLAAAYGDAWSTDILAELLKSVGHAGKSLETWLRDKFFAQHCKLFHHRPFIWHIWDGLRDGFAALVNYHKLDRKHLETLIYTYVGDWIIRQEEEDRAKGREGEGEKTAAAKALKKRLELILAGESPHDIFVRWKPLSAQPIGWEPDLNDGVRLNIRPFMSVPDVKKKGAGVLRDKPNIHWKKDRGKDVATAPWHPVHQGDRINDHHLTLAEKQAARKE